MALLGADYLVFANGRVAVGPVVLGSSELRELRDRVETAIYTSAKREVTLREDGIAAAVRLVDAMITARQAA